MTGPEAVENGLLSRLTNLCPGPEKFSQTIR